MRGDFLKTSISSLMANLQSGVNFIKVFTCSLYAHRSRKLKKLLDLTVFLALSGSLSVKAGCKMLMKLTPNIVRTLSTLTNVSKYASCSLSLVESCNRRISFAEDMQSFVDTEKTVEITRLSKASNLKLIRKIRND